MLDDLSIIGKSLFNTSSVVLHAAGIVGNEAVSKDINISRKINIDGTKKSAEISRDSSISRFIYVSSSHVYAPTDGLLVESSKVDPAGAYAE